METGQRLFDVLVFFGKVAGKGIFQRFVPPVVLLEEFEEIQRIGGLESAVFELQEGFAVLFLVVEDKVIRGPTHQAEEFLRFTDDGFALPPGQHRRPEPRDLYVLKPAEPVGDTNRVSFDKCRPVIAFCVFLQQFFYILRHVV